jgi:hypothetical protein
VIAPGGFVGRVLEDARARCGQSASSLKSSRRFATVVSNDTESRHPERVFLGDDLLAWLLLAVGGALFLGNVVAIAHPPDKTAEDALERAPLGRSLLMAGIGLIGAVWGLATLVTS